MATKVTLIYNLVSGGAKRPAGTESYLYIPTPQGLLDPALILAVETFMNARTDLMGFNIEAVGYRLSVPGMRNQSRLVLASTDQGVNIHQQAGVDQGPADPYGSSVQCGGFSAGLQRSNKYLAGLPDAFITTLNNKGPNFSAPGLVGYQATWNTWKAILISGAWGFKAINPLPAGQPFDILSWGQMADPPFNLQFVVPNASAIWDNGEVVHIRGVLMVEKWMPRPIGQYRIKNVSTDGTNTTYTLGNTGNLDASQIEEPGTVEEVTTSVVAYQIFEVANQSRRKRGVGPVRPVGRSRCRHQRRLV